MKRISIILSCLFLACCTNEKSEANNKNNNSNTIAVASSTPPSSFKTKQDSEMNSESGFKPNFIKADALLERLNKKENVYIFDVRGQVSYDESHIKGALSKPIPITAALVMGIEKNAKIITYCGCPHHLSSIAAEQLTQMGYKDVHVLDEGFWYWKDHKYPLEEGKSTKAKISELNLSGNLLKAGQPVVNKDIYIKHIKTGQLEATRTDSKGFYKMKFHIYNYKNNDEFKFYVEDLRNPVQDFKTNKKDNDNIIVNL
ncbi:MAG: rhodanese-like domain-containing protein [Candidatus Sericytochromatia bacterium]